ncbi:NADPH-dependent FMN reductase [Sphingobacterium sp. Mn56C]|uniref:NADPH-dependent FMN reductase n=1 Tax=Sphingobacterium sp. Mn56C TaxID=3395261 RepID=UPI003BD3906B
MEKKVGIIVGSLRKESYNKKVAKLLTEIAPKELSFEFIDIANIPLYNQDFDDLDQIPPEYITFRKSIENLDAVLFVTPEYNRSMPAVLKNAIDVASRPYGHNKWDKKPAGIVSVSVGNISGFGANHHLRQTLTFINMPTMQQPEAYFGHVSDVLEENGECKDPKTIAFLTNFMQAFAAWIKLF